MTALDHRTAATDEPRFTSAPEPLSDAVLQTEAPQTQSLQTETGLLRNPAGEATEASLLPRLVVVITPFFTLFVGWLAGWVSQHTGVKLDQSQMVALMVTTSTSAFGASWKWLHGRQQHEQLVARGLDVPRKAGPNAPAPPAPA
jgi:hypothetical protein